MIDCNLGPDFKSCFLGHKQSEYGKTFTVRLAKHMCYEDARLVQHFVNQKAMRQWIDAVTNFCEGNNVLRDCLIGMTACYTDPPVEFHLLRGSSLTRDVSRPPENYYF